MITRREFTSKSGKGLLALTALATIPALEGCNVAGDIASWSEVGLASFNAIVAVLTSNGIILPTAAQTLITDVQAAFTSLEAAAKEYGSANPPPVGSLAKLQLVLKSVVDGLSAFLAATGIPGGNILTLIAGLASVIFSTIAAFQNELPTSTQLVGATFKVGSQTVPVNAKKRNRRQFKRDWNSDLNSGVKAGLNIPKTAYLKLTPLEHIGL